MNGSQCSKHKRLHVKIESSQSSPSKSDFTRTSRSHTTCIAVKANSQHEAAKCQICLEKQEFSLCVPIETTPWRMTLEAITINMSVFEE